MKALFIILIPLGFIGWYFLNKNPKVVIEPADHGELISDNQEPQVRLHRPLVQLKNPTHTSAKASARTIKDHGGLSAVYMKKRMENYREQFLNCQKNTLRKNKFVVGDLLVGFSVSPLGTTDDIKILNSTLNHKSMENCVLGVFHRARFKRFDGEDIYFSYPLSFK